MIVGRRITSSFFSPSLSFRLALPLSFSLAHSTHTINGHAFVSLRLCLKIDTNIEVDFYTATVRYPTPPPEKPLPLPAPPSRLASSLLLSSIAYQCATISLDVVVIAIMYVVAAFIIMRCCCLKISSAARGIFFLLILLSHEGEREAGRVSRILMR